MKSKLKKLHNKDILKIKSTLTNNLKPTCLYKFILSIFYHHFFIQLLHYVINIK